jgi:hypothetical protein
LSGLGLLDASFCVNVSVALPVSPAGLVTATSVFWTTANASFDHASTTPQTAANRNHLNMTPPCTL